MSTPIPFEDADLDAVFQSLIAGITGIDGTLVRPRWQPVPPQQPPQGTDWCACGVTVETSDAGPSIAHDGTGDGSDTYIRHKAIEVFASFYGPNSKRNAGVLSDGLAVPQNTEGLLAIDMRWIECGPIRTAPEFVNQQWIQRRDLVVRFRRKVTRIYPVLNLTSAAIAVEDDSSINLTVTVPPNGRLPA